MPPASSFYDLALSESTLNALERKGFKVPSPIQALAIPLLLDGRKDVIGQAHTGTGKTAAFGIPIIESLRPEKGRVQALILSPTRELCLQITEELNSLLGDRKLRIASFYGGQAIEVQLKALRSGVDVAVGTPGRVIDLLERGKLDLSNLAFAVLDEADEMLNMGFLEDMERILGVTNPDKRTLMFSATMPPEIRSIAERFMREYEHLIVEKSETESGLTEQVYYEVTRANKIDVLSRLIDLEPAMYAIVFCRTRGDVDELTEKLRQRGYEVEALHGDITQSQRTKVINRFRNRSFPILIATDVAARGIDVSDLTHVINYSIPQGGEAYIHRIGRTGRAGKTGVAVTFVTPAESRRLAALKRLTPRSIRRESIPEASDIVAAKKNRYLKQLRELASEDIHRDHFDFAEEILSAFANPVEAVAAMLKQSFQAELLESGYARLSTNSDRRHSEEEQGNRNQVRLFISAGKRDGYGAVKLLDLIFQRTGLRSFKLGKIDCYDDFSYLGASPADAKKIMAAFQRQNGPKVELADAASPSRRPAETKHPRPEKREKKPRKLRELVEELELPLKPKRSKKRK